MKNNKIQGHSSMFFANVLWGCMAPISKAVLSQGIVLPIALTTFRLVGGAVVFWIASLFFPKEHVHHKDLVLLFFASLLGIVFNQGVFIWGVSMTSPIDASIISTFTPIITMIIAAFYLKEPVTGKKVIGIFMGAIGAFVLVMSSSSSENIATLKNKQWGNLLCLIAQVSFSLYIVLFKGLVSRYSAITIMKWMFTYAAISVIPFSFDEVSAINFTILPIEMIWELAYIIILGTFVPYLLIPIGQRILRPTVASIYNYVQPIVAALLAVFWGMDSFGTAKVVSVALIFTGVYIVTQSKSKVQMDAEQALNSERKT